MPKMLHALGDKFHNPRDHVTKSSEWNAKHTSAATFQSNNTNRFDGIEFSEAEARSSGDNIRRNSIRAFHAYELQ